MDQVVIVFVVLLLDYDSIHILLARAFVDRIDVSMDVGYDLVVSTLVRANLTLECVSERCRCYHPVTGVVDWLYSFADG